jgi:hypothetical protein
VSAYRRGRVVVPSSIVLVLVRPRRHADTPLADTFPPTPLADPFPPIPVGFLRVILSRSGSHPPSVILRVRPNARRFE